MLSSQGEFTEERVDQVVAECHNSYNKGSLEKNHWPPYYAVYKVSIAAVNTYTGLTTKKHPNFCINIVCPCYVNTILSFNLGTLSATEATEAPDLR